MSDLGINCAKCFCSNGAGEHPWRIKDIGFESRYCPKQQITPFSWWMLQLFGFYQDGHLPATGGVADQPHKILQAFGVISERRAHNARQKAPRGKKTPR